MNFFSPKKNHSIEKENHLNISEPSSNLLKLRVVHFPREKVSLNLWETEKSKRPKAMANIALVWVHLVAPEANRPGDTDPPVN